MFKWTKELVIEESKKYKTRTEFSQKKSAAYKFARINGLLDEMVWLVRPKPKRSEINDYCVYCYIDECNKVAYIGLTDCPRKRHHEHFSNCKQNMKNEQISIVKKRNRKHFLNCE